MENWKRNFGGHFTNLDERLELIREYFVTAILRARLK